MLVTQRDKVHAHIWRVANFWYVSSLAGDYSAKKVLRMGSPWSEGLFVILVLGGLHDPEVRVQLLADEA